MVLCVALCVNPSVVGMSKPIAYIFVPCIINFAFFKYFQCLLNIIMFIEAVAIKISIIIVLNGVIQQVCVGCTTHKYTRYG